MRKIRVPLQSIPHWKRALGLNLDVSPPQKEAVKVEITFDAPIIIPIQRMVSLGPNVLALTI
jgi:hypothetical protein